MVTKQIYYQDPYKMELESTVVDMEKSGNLTNIILRETIFYPEGGGQPSDKGEVIGKNGGLKVNYVRNLNGEIVHQGQEIGNLNPGDNVSLKIDWNWRYKYMKIHSAGHLLHDVLVSLNPDIIPIKGSHGKKPYLVYKGKINSTVEDVEFELNKQVQAGLTILTKEADLETIKKECQFVPSNLPANKNLRMIKIGDFPGMPDGGIHVRSTNKLGKVYISKLSTENDQITVKYGVVLK